MSLQSWPGRLLCGRSYLKPLACLAVIFLLTASAEIILRLLPVSEPFLEERDVTAADPLLKAKPNGRFAYSEGYRLAQPNIIHTNNAGFVNNQDYDPNDPRPLIAVVGDSFISALPLPYEATVQGRLANRLGPPLRVYSFAMPGAPPSQYLAYARHARDHYRPSALVVVLNNSDYDESMKSLFVSPGFHQFADGGGGLVLELSEMRRTHATVFHAVASGLGLGKLALVRYIRQAWPDMEAKLSMLLHPARDDDPDLQKACPRYRPPSPECLEASRRGVDALLEQLPGMAGLAPSRILLVVDGIRPALYSEKELAAKQGCYVDMMRRYLLARAEAKGFGVLDMQPLFIKRFFENDRHFETAPDWHWNSEGHAAAADAIANWPLLKALADAEALPGSARALGTKAGAQ